MRCFCSPPKGLGVPGPPPTAVWFPAGVGISSQSLWSSRWTQMAAKASSGGESRPQNVHVGILTPRSSGWDCIWKQDIYRSD